MKPSQKNVMGVSTEGGDGIGLPAGSIADPGAEWNPRRPRYQPLWQSTLLASTKTMRNLNSELQSSVHDVQESIVKSMPVISRMFRRSTEISIANKQFKLS